jgi:hypothetical protein
MILPSITFSKKSEDPGLDTCFLPPVGLPQVFLRIIEDVGKLTTTLQQHKIHMSLFLGSGSACCILSPEGDGHQVSRRHLE